SYGAVIGGYQPGNQAAPARWIQEWQQPFQNKNQTQGDEYFAPEIRLHRYPRLSFAQKKPGSRPGCRILPKPLRPDHRQRHNGDGRLLLTLRVFQITEEIAAGFQQQHVVLTEAFGVSL